MEQYLPDAIRSFNGAEMDRGDTLARMFDARCPDGGRVCIHGEEIDE